MKYTSEHLSSHNEETSSVIETQPVPRKPQRQKKRRTRLIVSLLLIIIGAVIVYVLAALNLKSPHLQIAPGIGLGFPQQPSVSHPGAGCATVPNPDNQPVHLDNEEMKNEHQALLALVPVNHATDIAGYTGNWDDPSIWCSGHIPGKNADVLIPSGSTVTYNVQSTEALHTLRIDGTLQFATDKTTTMELDTLVVSPVGTITIGTEKQPVANSVSTTITFTDNGPIDTHWDPLQLSRGMLVHGSASIYGAAKTTFLALAQAPVAGTTTLTLSQPPANWHVGDTVVLTGTQPGRTDEERIIQSMNGTQITLNTPLKYNHLPPASDLQVYLANYTRNIVFKSANIDDVSRRGHIMFMHTNRASVNYAEMYQLGRTNKAEWADDPGIIRKGVDHTTEGKGLNPRGRYALHFHLAGADKNQPATVIGCAVYGSPGWGFVNHQSNVIMKDNAAYNVLGAAFVGEDGNEIGSMIHNIAIGSDGSAKYGHRQYAVGGPHTDPTLLDMWHSGQGFAFRGQGIAVEDNVCTNQAYECYTWDGWDAPTIPMPQVNLAQPAITNNAPTINFSNVPIADFKRNIAFATQIGVHTDGITESATDARNVFEDLTIWNVGSGNLNDSGQYYGILMRYGGHTTIRNLRLVDNYDRNVNPNQRHIGVTTGPNMDLVIDNAQISGFYEAIDNLQAQETGDTQWKVPTVVLDSTLTNNDKKYATSDPTYLLEESKSTLDLNKLDIVVPSDINRFAWPGAAGPVLTGKIVDGLGERTTVFDGGSLEGSPGWMQEFYTSNDSIKSLLRKGYYRQSDGTTYVVADYAIYNRITGTPKVIHQKITLKLDDWKSQGPIGPNLGTFQGELK